MKKRKRQKQRERNHTKTEPFVLFQKNNFYRSECDSDQQKHKYNRCQFAKTNRAFGVLDSHSENAQYSRNRKQNSETQKNELLLRIVDSRFDEIPINLFLVPKNQNKSINQGNQKTSRCEQNFSKHERSDSGQHHPEQRNSKNQRRVKTSR